MADLLTDLGNIYSMMGGLASILINIVLIGISLIPALISVGLFIFTHLFQFLIMFEIVILAISIRKISFIKIIQSFYDMNYFLISKMYLIASFLIEKSISIIQIIRG